VTFDLKTKI